MSVSDAYQRGFDVGYELGQYRSVNVTFPPAHTKEFAQFVMGFTQGQEQGKRDQIQKLNDEL